VTSDGKRFLLASPQIQQIAKVVVVNWRAQLKK
jgi:hypothetical protein